MLRPCVYRLNHRDLVPDRPATDAAHGEPLAALCAAAQMPAGTEDDGARFAHTDRALDARFVDLFVGDVGEDDDVLGADRVKVRAGLRALELDVLVGDVEPAAVLADVFWEPAVPRVVVDVLEPLAVGVYVGSDADAHLPVLEDAVEFYGHFRCG